MALTIGDNFSYQGAKPLDGRIKYNTIAAMKAMADSTLYDGCLAYCVATEKNYQWKSTNAVDETLGKWREFETSGSSGHIIENSSGTDMTARTNLQFQDMSVTDDSTNDRTIVKPNTVTASRALVSDSNGKVSASSVTDTQLGYLSGVTSAIQAQLDTKYGTGDTAFTDIADADYIPVYDTSASAKKKSLWSNIKSKLKTYFDTLYNDFTIGDGLDVTSNTLSTDRMESSEIDDLDIDTPGQPSWIDYSLEEQDTGIRWIDGNKIYQKTINFGALPNSTSKSVNHGISNVDQWIYIGAIAQSSDKSAIPISDSNKKSGTVYIIRLSVSSTAVLIKTDEDRSSASAYVTLRYTKTT